MRVCLTPSAFRNLKRWELTPAYDSTDGQREALTGLTREIFTNPGKDVDARMVS